ncbi:site-specific integrase [Roseospira goensis]|uniref:Integrase n=1 Tax=Roseospira goensis TaxID=391922 RepID=A0A7W6WLF1_9PROT|nr:site-specific integrase [Roseospira goensis]MBB4286754.1 integrase [Roseospira goensis]
MADLRYLKKRRQTWYFRLTVPPDLRDKLGKTEIVESLGTRDLSLAQSRRWDWRATWEDRFDALRGNERQDRAAIRETYKRTLQEARDGFLGKPEGDEHEFTIGDTISALVEQGERKTKQDGEVDPITEAKIHALQDYAAERRGETVKTKAVYAMTINEAAKRYLDAIAKEITLQTRGQYEATFRLFADFMDDKPLRDVTRRDAAAFLEELARFSPTWGRSPKTKDRSFADLKALYAGKGEGLSQRTLNRYITALSGLWKWARDREEVGGENPFDRFFKAINEKNSSGYVPFSLGDLNALFALPAPTNPVLWEVPLVALFTGMRLGEVCSLTWENVQQEDGIWFFDITAAKSVAGIRVVPVHDALGWLVARRPTSGADLANPIWPVLKPGGPDGKRSWYMTKAFGTFRRSRGITDKGKVFHSFRKNAVQCLERARVPQNEAAEIVGHEKEGITYRVYNPDGLTMAQRREVVRKIAYPGLVLPEGYRWGAVGGGQSNAA